MFRWLTLTYTSTLRLARARPAYGRTYAPRATPSAAGRGRAAVRGRALRAPSRVAPQARHRATIVPSCHQATLRHLGHTGCHQPSEARMHVHRHLADTTVLAADWCALLLLLLLLLLAASAPRQYRTRPPQSHAEVGETSSEMPSQAPSLDYSLGQQAEQSRPSSLRRPHRR